MDNLKRELKAGDVVVFIDAKGVRHNALVTTWWAGGYWIDSKGVRLDHHTAPTAEDKQYVNCKTIEEFRAVHGCTTNPAVNVVYVLPEAGQHDQYGHQKKHETSISHGDAQTPKRLGFCWLFPDE